MRLRHLADPDDLGIPKETALECGERPQLRLAMHSESALELRTPAPVEPSRPVTRFPRVEQEAEGARRIAVSLGQVDRIEIGVPVARRVVGPCEIDSDLGEAIPELRQKVAAWVADA